MRTDAAAPERGPSAGSIGHHRDKIVRKVIGRDKIDRHKVIGHAKIVRRKGIDRAKIDRRKAIGRGKIDRRKGIGRGKTVRRKAIGRGKSIVRNKIFRRDRRAQRSTDGEEFEPETEGQSWRRSTCRWRSCSRPSAAPSAPTSTRSRWWWRPRPRRIRRRRARVRRCTERRIGLRPTQMQRKSQSVLRVLTLPLSCLRKKATATISATQGEGQVSHL